MPIHDRTSTYSFGFTLVELLTAIVILGILSAVALPRLFDNRDFEERGYIDEVASTLRYAQRIAIASECEVNVTLTAVGYTATQRSTLASCNSGTAAWNTQVRRIDGTPLVGSAPNGITLSPATTIVFNSEGEPNGNPPALDVGPFTLSIDGDSGLVTVTP